MKCVYIFVGGVVGILLRFIQYNMIFIDDINDSKFFLERII